MNCIKHNMFLCINPLDNNCVCQLLCPKLTGVAQIHSIYMHISIVKSIYWRLMWQLKCGRFIDDQCTVVTVKLCCKRVRHLTKALA